MRKYTVKLTYEEGTWCSDVAGDGFSVVLESGSFDALVERVKIAVQDILEVDFGYTGEIELVFQAERVDRLRSRAG